MLYPVWVYWYTCKGYMKKTTSKSAQKSAPKFKTSASTQLSAHDALIKRISRITGQAEGIRGMLEAGREAHDIIAQCKAVRASVKAVEAVLLEQQIAAAVNDILNEEKRKTREEKIKQLMRLL
jgi:CsoR family transcriptional regulator, copper-sensing transcriptional repressor